MRLCANSFSVALLFVCFSSVAQAAYICPDGSYVAQGPCTICPNGKYVGGGAQCQIAPDGTYVPRQRNATPQITPDGSYVQGGKKVTICPDGSYVAGSRCEITPSGGFVGR